MTEQQTAPTCGKDTSDTTLCIYRGDSFIFAIHLLQDDGTTPVDLTGYTARMQVRPKPGASTDPPLVEISDSAGGIIIDGPEGTLTLELSPTNTGPDLASVKKAWYDVELTETETSRVTTPVKGEIQLEDQVTQ